MASRRVWHSMGWGMVAAAVVGVIPHGAIAFGLWPAPTGAPVTASFFAQVLGLHPKGPTALLLALVWQLGYGAFWGAFLAHVSGPFSPEPEPLVRPSMFLYGLGLGLFRFFVGSLTVLLYLGWGPFSLLASPFIALAMLVSSLGFGLVLSWLVAREDAGLITFRVPSLRMLPFFTQTRERQEKMRRTHVIWSRRFRRGR
jgi:hypothetical protein